MHKVVSKDGTIIAFDVVGDGPPLVMMGGALNDRQTTAPLAELLAPRFTVFNYDRRGRGDSGDTLPYAIDREIEDLEAVVAEAGGQAQLFANCTGGMIAMEAVARGLEITKLALYEPPYIVDDGHPPADEAYRTRLNELLAEGRRSDAVELFMLKVGIPPHVAARRHAMPIWPSIEAMAPTLAYDAVVVGDNSLPPDLPPRVPTRTLVMVGSASPPWQLTSGRVLADALPNGVYGEVEGQNHKLVAEAVAPVLEAFLVS